MKEPWGREQKCKLRVYLVIPAGTINSLVAGVVVVVVVIVAQQKLHCLILHFAAAPDDSVRMRVPARKFLYLRTFPAALHVYYLNATFILLHGERFVFSRCHS